MMVEPVAAAAPSDPKPRDRSIAARRAARIRKFERERLIVDCLNRGVPVAEIAGRIGVTEKRMRALMREILARRMPEAPEEFAAIQASRLNEALLVAYSAMSPENLKAVALVVRIVRELDRYHGFVPAGQRPRREPAASDAEPTAAPAAPTAAPAARPETAPEELEKIESAPEETAILAAPDEAAAAPDKSRLDGGAGRPNRNVGPSTELLEPASASCAGARDAKRPGNPLKKLDRDAKSARIADRRRSLG